MLLLYILSLLKFSQLCLTARKAGKHNLGTFPARSRDHGFWWATGRLYHSSILWSISLSLVQVTYHFSVCFSYSNILSCLVFAVAVVSFIVLFVLVGLGLSYSLTIILVKFWLGAEAHVQLHCPLKFRHNQMTTEKHPEVHLVLLAMTFQFLNYTMNTFSYENEWRELYILTEKYVKQK